MSFRRQLENLGRHLEEEAGPEARGIVMEGVERLPKSVKPDEVATWVKGAMDRMDAILGEETRGRVMDLCGLDCAAANARVVTAAVSRRGKHGSLEEYLAAEERKPSRGTRFKRDGDVYYQWYTPRLWGRPMRCYCGLLKGLPEGVEASPTYCRCSEAFVRMVWERVLGEPVDVRVLESAVSGSDECMFEIRRRHVE
jgi:hypothetical protein